MRTRIPLGTSLLLALLTTACLGERQILIGEYTPARSFVLVTLDTTRPDHLSPYGARGVETPSLQALADGGAVFENAYAATPVTLPSHATILTGLDPPRHGVRNNGLQALGEEMASLGEILRDAGFDTAAFVSAAVLERRWGTAQGFEVYDDDFTGGKPKELRMITERPASVTVEAALGYLSKRFKRGDDQRLFLWVHLFDPHAAYEPPEPWASRFADRPYDGEIAAMDFHLGRLLAHPSLGDEDTLVMAVADHGESLGQHGEASHAMLVYDSTIRIPWIARGPGIAPGARPRVPVGQVDLLPTALELLGLAAATPAGLDGVSRAPVLAATDPASLGQAARQARAVRDLYAETFVPFYTYGWARLRSLRRGPWKYIEAPAPELYDVATDPGELENLHGEHPERADALARALTERLREAEAVTGDNDEGDGGRTASLDRETRERLRSLGYLAPRTPADDRPDAERPDPKALIGVHRAMDRAEHLLYSRRFEAAEEELLQVLSQDEGNLAALEALAKALGELGRTDEALGALDRALERAPEDAGLHLTRAGLEVARGRPEAALPALDAALALDPGFVDARVEKARVLLDLAATDEDGSRIEERRTEARHLLEGVLEDDPDNARAAVVWSEVAESDGTSDGDTVEARLERATTAEPYLAEGWRALGRARQRRGDVAGAVETYRRGLEFQPRDAGLRALLGLALAERAEDGGDLDEARDQLERARTLSPRPLAEVHDGLAALAAAAGDWHTARREARRAVELDPALASGWNHLAVALEEEGDMEGALSAYRRAEAARPATWQATFNRGLLLRRLERLGEAEVAFRRVLELEPDHAAAHYELGVLYGATGREALARQQLEAARRAEPDHPRVETIERLLGMLGG